MSPVPAASDARRPFRPAYLTVIGLALAARLAMVVYAWQSPERFLYPDSRRYVNVAQNIAAGRGPIFNLFSYTVVAGADPLYPLLLAVAPAAGFGELADIMNWGRVVNAALGMLALPAVFRLGRRAGGDAAAVMAGALFASDPILLFFHGLVLTEVPYLCALLWGTEFVLMARERSAGAWAAAAGAALGLSVLARSSGLFLILALVPLLLTGRSPARRRRRLALAAVCLAAFAAVLAPTAWRNYRLLGRFVPVRSGAGATLLEGLGPWADGGPGMEKVKWPDYPAGADEVVQDEMNREAALAWARAHPRRVVQLAWAKLKRTWSLVLHAPRYEGPFFRGVSLLTVTPVYLGALLGAWILRHRPGLLWALLAPAVYFSLMHMVFVGSVRYRLPAMPGLFVLSGAAVSCWVAARRGREAT